MKILFDQYQRYKNAQLIINDLRVGNEKFRILEVGANEHKNLEHFLPSDDILYLDIHLSEEKLQDEQYILGDATDMDFADDSFDIVVALDVYEHIPAERRAMFIKELNRVAKVGFVISAPFDDPQGEVHRAEERMNEAYRALYGGVHPWLIEHIENGLPALAETERLLVNLGINYEVFGHGDIDLWEQMMYMQIMADYDKNLLLYFDTVSEYYNEVLFQRDYSVISYRNFIVGDKMKRGLKFERKYDIKDEKLHYLYQTFTTVLDNVKLNQNHEILKKIEARNLQFYSQIYLDEGNGISEELSLKKNINNNKILYQYTIPTDKSVFRLRFDPINEGAIIQIHELLLIDEVNKEKQISNEEILQNSFNIEHLGKNYYLCDGKDAQIYISHSKSIKALRANIDIAILEEEHAQLYMKQVSNNYKKLFDKEVALNNHINKVTNDKLVLEHEKSLLESRALQYKNMYEGILDSFCWKITAPFRSVGDIFSQHLITRAIQCVKDNGLKYTINLYKTGGYDKGSANYVELIEENEEKRATENKNKKKSSSTLDYHDLQKQKNHTFNRDIRFSILVPLYNTPEQFLKEMITSVEKQTYANWELCLADGSDDEHGAVGEICKKYVEKDTRIHYKKLEKNNGIAENTNECLKMSSGDYIGLFDHDDILHPSALYRVMERIDAENADLIYTDENTFHESVNDAFLPHYKPDYSPDTLRSYNYICHFTVFSRELFEKVGFFNKEFDGSQDYDYILRLTETAKRIVHIPEILYYWRAHENSVASDLEAKPYTIDAAKGAIKKHLERVGLTGNVENSSVLSTYKINYAINGNPKISILIPNKDHVADLEKCIDSVLTKSTYSNYEIIIIENNSEKNSTFAYYDFLRKDSRIKVLCWEGGFNYSAINNFGEREATGDYILLLNNDVEIITPNWMEELLMFAQRKDVGAVGAMLYYPDDTIQHAGVILGVGGIAGHSHKYFKRGDYGYFSRLTIAQNLSCVTAACLMVKRSIYEEVGGLDEELEVAFNDVDFCLKIRKAGYLNVFTPYAELYHFESKSRGFEDTIEKQIRFTKEANFMQDRWGQLLEQGDPYYNKNLTLEKEDFSYE